MNLIPRRRMFGMTSLLALAMTPLAAGQVTYTVTTTDDTVDNNPGDGICADVEGECSLRAAIQEANASRVAAIIKLDKNATYQLTLAGADEDEGATGDLDVTTNIVLQGNNATIDAMQLDRAFDVASGGRLLVDRVTIMNGLVDAASGGAIRSAGNLSVQRSTLMSNDATGAGASGGAIFNDGGIAEIDRSTLTDNEAERAGGAVEANGGLTVIARTDVLSNAAGPTPGNGGGLHLTGTGIVHVTKSVFDFNSAASEGGGLWNSATGSMVVDRTDVTNNTADGADADNGGGGLFNDGGDMSVTRCKIITNTAPTGSGSGGGIFNNGGTLGLDRTLLEGNSAQRAGGGIEANAGSTTLIKSQLIENAAGPTPGNGGALHLTGEGAVTVENCKIQDNTASAEGGGLWNSSTGTMVVQGSLLRGNAAGGADADQGGGGLFNDGGLMTVARSQIRDNVADGASGSGGGLLNNDGTLFVTDTRFIANLSQRAGGGIEANIGTTTLEDVRFQKNSTGPSPGNGGAVHLTGAGLVTVEGGDASKNEAANEGGALWNSATGTMIVNDVKVKSNDAPTGPDFFNDGGTFTVDGEDIASDDE